MSKQSQMTNLFKQPHNRLLIVKTQILQKNIIWILLKMLISHHSKR